MSINRLARGAATEEHYEFVPPPEVAPKQLIAGTSSVMAFQAAYSYPAPTRRGAARAYGGVGAAIAGEVAGPIVNTVLKWLEAAVEGDITYKMPEYLNGWKHVDDNTSIVGVGPVETRTVTIEGPYLQNGDQVGLDLLVRWDYDGSKLGYVSVRPANPRDAVGWGLHVEVVPHDERKDYAPDRSPGLAAIRLECTYKFDAPPYYDDSIDNMDVLLFGDGTYKVERH
jgi:hypothetical protein